MDEDGGENRRVAASLAEVALDRRTGPYLVNLIIRALFSSSPLLLQQQHERFSRSSQDWKSNQARIQVTGRSRSRHSANHCCKRQSSTSQNHPSTGKDDE